MRNLVCKHESSRHFLSLVDLIRHPEMMNDLRICHRHHIPFAICSRIQTSTSRVGGPQIPQSMPTGLKSRSRGGVADACVCITRSGWSTDAVPPQTHHHRRHLPPTVHMHRRARGRGRGRGRGPRPPSLCFHTCISASSLILDRNSSSERRSS